MVEKSLKTRQELAKELEELAEIHKESHEDYYGAQFWCPEDVELLREAAKQLRWPWEEVPVLYGFGTTTAVEGSSETLEKYQFSTESNPLNKRWDVAALVAYIETLFDCQDGYFGPYCVRGHDRDEYYYRTLHPKIEGNIAGAQQLLLDEMARIFTNIYDSLPKDPKPVLFWRFAKGARIQEEEQKAAFGREHYYGIYTRVAIPAANWRTLGLELDNHGRYNPAPEGMGDEVILFHPQRLRDIAQLPEDVEIVGIVGRPPNKYHDWTPNPYIYIHVRHKLARRVNSGDSMSYTLVREFCDRIDALKKLYDDGL